RIYTRYEHQHSALEVFRNILSDAEFSVPWEGLDRDAGYLAAAFADEVAPEINSRFHQLRFDLLEAEIYRGKAASLVGRVHEGCRTLPVVVAVCNNEAGGLATDTDIFRRADMSGS